MDRHRMIEESGLPRTCAALVLGTWLEGGLLHLNSTEAELIVRI
jgi:hypothetical protein